MRRSGGSARAVATPGELRVACWGNPAQQAPAGIEGCALFRFHPTVAERRRRTGSFLLGWIHCYWIVLIASFEKPLSFPDASYAVTVK